MARRNDNTEVSRKVELRSGGMILVSAMVDFARLTPSDRAFVFALLDKLAEYEQPATPAGTVTP